MVKSNWSIKHTDMAEVSGRFQSNCIPVNFHKICISHQYAIIKFAYFLYGSVCHRNGKSPRLCLQFQYLSSKINQKHVAQYWFFKNVLTWISPVIGWETTFVASAGCNVQQHILKQQTILEAVTSFIYSIIYFLFKKRFKERRSGRMIFHLLLHSSTGCKVWS